MKITRSDAPDWAIKSISITVDQKIWGFEHFLVEEYLRKELQPEEWEKIFGRPPKSKMLSLVELIEQAKKIKKEKI